MSSYYRTAQICLNGHCISDSVDAYPQYAQSFCTKCGAPTITACQECGAKIRGEFYVEGVCYIGGHYDIPAYCYQCGKPYPWTKSALEAAAALIQGEDGLSAIDQEQLISTLPDLISETPKTNLAAARFKKVLSSVGSFTADGLRQFAIDFGCELAKKMLGL